MLGMDLPCVITKAMRWMASYHIADRSLIIIRREPILDSIVGVFGLHWSLQTSMRTPYNECGHMIMYYNFCSDACTAISYGENDDSIVSYWYRKKMWMPLDKLRSEVMPFGHLNKTWPSSQISAIYLAGWMMYVCSNCLGWLKELRLLVPLVFPKIVAKLMVEFNCFVFQLELTIVVVLAHSDSWLVMSTWHCMHASSWCSNIARWVTRVLHVLAPYISESG